MKNFIVHHQVKFQSPFLQSFQANNSKSLMVWEVLQTWNTTSKRTLNIFYQVNIPFIMGLSRFMINTLWLNHELETLDCQGRARATDWKLGGTDKISQKYYENFYKKVEISKKWGYKPNQLPLCP